MKGGIWLEGYITVFGESTGEYSEKRSRFIATLRHCDSEEQAIAFAGEMRTKYWDAKHNVFAYSIWQNSVKRFSDDGEPHGTAGKPVLDVITGGGITNAAIVVTRYFGGVLLGTGGLVRAYSAAAKAALAAAERVAVLPCKEYITVCSYNDYGALVNLIKEAGGIITDTVFEAEVKVSYYLKAADSEGFLKKLSESFSARIAAKPQAEKMLPFNI